MKKFIYVFSDDDKTKLLSLGYVLMKKDERQNVYVFENRPTDMNFSDNGIKCVFSNMLTF